MESELFKAIEEQCSIEVLQKFISDVKNVNLKNRSGEAALHFVIRKWSDKPKIVQAVKLLIDAGADVNLENGNGLSVIEALLRSNCRRPKLYKISKILIKAGGDVNSTQQDGLTLLHLAASDLHDRPDFIRFLFKHGCDINFQDRFGHTSLHYASFMKFDKEVAEILIDAGAKLNLKNEAGETALYLAAEDTDNQIDVVRLLLQRGADINSQNCHGSTALHCAVEKGNKEVVECLIEAGAHVNLKNEDGQTALHLAANNNNPNQVGFIRLLLQCDGVDVDSRDKFEFTALQYAVRNKNKEVVQCLIDAGADVKIKYVYGQNVIELLIRSRYQGVQLMLEILEVLIKAGADVNSRNKYGRTGLHIAAMDIYNLIDFIQLLLKYGADVDSQDGFEFTALHFAVQKQNKEVVQCLIDAGADVNLKNGNGQSVIEVLIENYKFDIMEILMKAKADVTIKNVYGDTVLHLAAKSKYNLFSMIQYFLLQGVKVDTQNGSGWTALQYAVQKQNKEVVERLIAAGADVNVKNNYGQTALHLAAYNNNCNQIHFIRLFLQKGAIIDFKDCNGRTPGRLLQNINLLKKKKIRFDKEMELLKPISAHLL